MDYNKAIENLEFIKSEINLDHTKLQVKQISKKKIETINMAISAMEKQIPKKPKKILRHRGGFETYHCPNCNTSYCKDERYTIEDEYCPECGKLLDSGFRSFCGNCGQSIEQSDANG